MINGSSILAYLCNSKSLNESSEIKQKKSTLGVFFFNAVDIYFSAKQVSRRLCDAMSVSGAGVSATYDGTK